MWWPQWAPAWMPLWTPRRCVRRCRGSCRTTWCRRRSLQLAALPLTPNGKLDRRALPEPELGGAQSHRAPRNRAGGAALRAVRRAAAPAAGRHRRQLLRAWRRQHRVDPAGEPGAAGRAFDHAAAGVPAPDGGGAGCGRRGCGGYRRGRGGGRRCGGRACWPRRSCTGWRSAAGRFRGSARRCCLRCRAG